MRLPGYSPALKVGITPTARQVGPIGQPSFLPAQELKFSGVGQTRTDRLHFSGAQVKIMTFNMAELIRDSDERRWVKSPKSLSSTAYRINQEKPDVIAMQEVGSRNALEIYNRVYLHGQYGNIVVFPSYRSGHVINVAILAKNDFKIVDNKSHWQKQTPPVFDNRSDLIQATIETPRGYRFTVYTSHFKNSPTIPELPPKLPDSPVPPEVSARHDRMKRAGEAANALRLKQAEEAAKVIRQHLEREPEARIVMAGDLNVDHATADGREVLDTLSMANHPDSRYILTEPMLAAGRPEPTHAGNSICPPKKLDYMFLSRTMLADIVGAYVVGDFTKPGKNRGSDHRPEIIVIEEPD